MKQEDRSRWHHAQRAVGFAVVFSILVLVLPSPAAAVWDEIRDALLNFLGYILLFIAGVLGKLVMLVVNGLIGVAQYNNFVNSQPVTIGWPLVRDVVNMFFIVVLLIVAFSTIIQYEPFHYRKILPKLLLMAIMINFSKTMLGLLIDFSQVLVLTFVTAFQQAAAGNFVTALKLDKAFRLSQDAPQEPKDILGAIFLAVILLGVMLSATLIMLVFMLFRIVVLWILLIMSPIAFFALALPDKMKKGVEPFTNKFWGRLTSMLIAGPAMAFFLWLSLAIAQGPDPYFETVGTTAEAESALARTGAAGSPSASIEFSSAVGKPAEIVTFIVAIMLMLQGVEFGLSAAKDISEKLPGVLSKAVSPSALARGAGRLSWGATKLSARAADAVSGGRISKTVGRAGLKIAARLPGGVGAQTFANLATRRERRIGEETKRLGAITKGLSANDALAFLDARAKRNPNRFEAAAAQQKAGEIASGKAGLEALKMRQLLGEGGIPGMKGAINRPLAAEALALREARGRLTTAYATAEANGDTETMKALEERMASHPGLMDAKGLKKLATETIKSPKEVLATKNAEAFRSIEAAVAASMGAGMLKEDGSIDENSDGRKIMKKNPGEREKVFQEFLKATTNAQRAAIAAKFRGNATREQLDIAAKADGYIGKDASTGKYMAISLSDGRLMGAPPREPTPAERSAQRTMQNIGVQAMADLDKLKVENPTAYYGAQGQNARNDAVRAGRDLTQIFNFNVASGEFAKPEDRGAFAASMTQFVDKAANKDDDAAQTLKNLDLSMIKADPNDYNEARSAFVSSVDPMAFSVTFKNAKDANDTDMQKKLAEIATIIQQEADRTNKLISKAKVSPAELDRVDLRQDSPDRQAMVMKLMNAGAGNETRALEVARAAALAATIRDSEQFRDLRGVVGRKAQRVAQRRQRVERDDDDDTA